MKRNIGSFAMPFAVFLVLAAPAGSTDLPVRGLDASVYEYAYSRAEREGEPERWLQEARDGVAFAVALWERDALGLYSDPISLAAAREELESWSAVDLSQRFADWLGDRFFGSEASDLRYAVADAMRGVNERYLYVLGPEGEVLRDEAGNPRYLASLEGESLVQSRLAWTSDANASVLMALDSYENRLESMCPELLSYIPEADRERYAELFSKAVAEARGFASSELDDLLVREELFFIARKTADVWSLRSRSEREAASVIAATLAEEAAAECNQGLAALNASIEADSVDGGDFDLAGTEWLRTFRLQLDRGLTIWENAEERFMVRRLEWERDAAMAFDTGNETWAKAFEALTTERRAWEARASSLFRSGEVAFARASETLEASIREAKAEFEQAAFERSTASSDRASAWVDVYLQASAAAAGARESAAYWTSLLGEGVPSFSDPAFVPWLASEATKAGISQQRRDWLAQAADCLQVYNEYSVKACESRDRLIADFGLAIGSGSGSLRDILDAGASTEDFCLDEYQVELVRAKAIEGYWARRVEIADAVLEYAVDISSGRATAGDNIRNLEAASKAWNDALLRYDEAQAQLKEAGALVAGAREAMAGAREALAVAGARLENLDAEYSILMGSLVAGDIGFIGDALIARYRDLIGQGGLTMTDGAASEASLLAAYLEKARALGLAIDIERSGEALRVAVNGGEGEPSLAQLKAAWVEILELADPSEAPLDAGAYGIPETSVEYAAIQSLLQELQKALAGAGSSREREVVLESFQRLLSKTADRARTRAGVALDTRLDGIALLGAQSAAAWYRDRAGGLLPEGSLATVLAADQRSASRNCLLARAELELEALGVIAGIIPEGRASDDANSLTPWWSSGDMPAEAAYGSLSRLVDFLHDRVDSDDATFDAGIEALARGDASIAMFARGKGFFQVAGLDIATLYCSTEIEALDRARGRYAACIAYGHSAMALEEERYFAARGVMSEALAPLGLAFEEGEGLPEASKIVAALFSGEVETAAALSSLLSATDAAAARAPAWMTRELSGWKDALLEYAAAKSLHLGLPLPGSSADYRLVLNDSAARISLSSTVLHLLAGDEASVFSALCLASSDSHWSIAERKLIEDEIAERLAVRLRTGADDFGLQHAGLDPDWVAIEASLAAIAEQQSGSVSYSIRTRAVQVALESLRGIDAVANARDPSILAGAALDARLADIWSNVDLESLRTSTASAEDPVSRTAYAMRELVFNLLAGLPGGAVRDDLLAFSESGPDGEPSWLAGFYESEGQDSGTVMQSLLELAAEEESEPWSLDLARSRVEAAALDSLSGLIAYRDALRQEMGMASGASERLLAGFLAMRSYEPGFFAWIIDVLGLRHADGLERFVGTHAADDTVLAEAFLGLGTDPCAQSAASHFLAALALAGNGAAVNAYSARAGDEASARAHAIMELKATASGYAGEYSGYALTWAVRNHCDDPAYALALVQYIESGLIDDPLSSKPGSKVPGEGSANPFDRWLTETVTRNAEEVLRSSATTAASLVWAEACERASRQAASTTSAGERHWRQYLDSPAILDSDVGLQMPLLAGDPEGERCAVPRAAASWAEGVLADSHEASERRTEALSAAFDSWARYHGEKFAPEEPAAYLAAPEKPFAAEEVIRAPALASNEYQTAAGAYASLRYRLAETVASLAGFAKAFNMASDQGAVAERLEVLRAEQSSMRVACDAAMLDYHRAGAAFDETSVAYEAAYTRAKSRYSVQETARSAYDLEEAIHRWAGTAYLEASGNIVPEGAFVAYRSPADELEYARVGHERAAIILHSLLGLHADADELRTYADPEYRVAVSDYGQNYSDLVLLAKARDVFSGALDTAYDENTSLYEAYQANLFGSQASGHPPVAIVPLDYSGYSVPTDADAAGWTDFLAIRDNGTIGLAFGSDYRLKSVDATTAARLATYFQIPSQAPSRDIEHDLHPATPYELDVRAWSSRVADHVSSQEKFLTWANAREFLLSSLVAANPEFGNLGSSVKHADNLYATIGQKRVEGKTIADLLGGYATGALAEEQRAAWDSLSAQERVDLEFYIIMTLSGGAERSAESFETATRLGEYEFASRVVSGRIDSSRRLASTLRISAAASWTLGVLLCWSPAGPPLLGAAVAQFGLALAADVDADEWQVTKTTFIDPGTEIQHQTSQSGLSGLQTEVSALQGSYVAYRESCDRISILEGAHGLYDLDLADFSNSLESIDGIEPADVQKISLMYKKYNEETELVSSGVNDALASVYRWILSKRDAARSKMENCYFDDQRARQVAESSFHEAAEGYLAGTVNEADLKSAMQVAFGGLAASAKTHLTLLSAIEKSAVLNTGIGASTRQYSEAVSAVAALTARADELRFSAELMTREAEWDLKRRDLDEKQRSWRESANLILKRGQADFEYGSDMLREKAKDWAQKFIDGYASRKPGWDMAYAGMQDEKLSWVSNATEIAGNASAEAMLALMCPDADAAVRQLDSFSVSRVAFETDTQTFFDDIMQQAGIAGMDAALVLQSGSVAALSLAAREGISNAGSINSGRIAATATDFVKNARNRISGIQARLMAARARAAAAAAAEGLYARVRQANENFSRRMAEVFIDGGMWKRQGNRFVKDIVVHATVDAPYIIEQAGIDAFRNYAIKDWSIATDLSDGTIANLGADSVQELISRAQKEVQVKHDEVFGTTEEMGAAARALRTHQVDVYREERGIAGTRDLTWTDDDGTSHSRTVPVYGMLDVLDHTEEQTDGAGEFGRHVGYAPIVRIGANPDDGENGIFQAAGSGELGRLMASYIYWSLKEGKGWSEASKPLYEKDLWDDRGDWLQAPTIRGVADLGVSVAAGILTGGAGALALNLVDDAAFGLLDISGGYRSWEQTSLDFAKKAASSAVDFSGSKIFGGSLGTFRSTVMPNRVMGSTILTGMKTVAEAVATNAIGAVNLAYDDTGKVSGLDFNVDGFRQNAFGEASVASYLGRMACTVFNASVDFKSAYTGRNWSGIASIGSMAANESAKFAAHAGYAAARGATGLSILDQAWSEHGGISIDVSNLGSIISAAGFLGGISSAGYSAIERAAYNKVASAFSGIGLSMNWGADGITGTFGGGGYNLVDMGLRAGKGLMLERKLESFATARGTTAAAIMRTAVGYGDFAAEETVWRIVSGKDALSFGRGGSRAETVADSTGNRIISLMERGSETGAMLDMAVMLQHESWRDGRGDTPSGQKNETMLAAEAHTGMALGLALGHEYSDAMSSLMAQDENYQDDLYHFVKGDFASYASHAYDSSGDFWKLTKEGRLFNDGKARLLAEIVNDDGTTGWHAVEDSDAETSTAAALVHYLGQSRAMELFGGSLCDVTRYDDQTLHDVLNLDEIDIKTIRRNPGEAERLIAAATPGQQERLMGEALMKGDGIKWDSGALIWIGDGGNLTISDRAIMGTAAIKSIGAGLYERYSITSEIERMEGAYGVWINGQKGDVGEGNTRVAFTKWDIDSSEQLATIVAGGAWNSVDNSYGQLDSSGMPIGADQPYKIAFGPTLQGNTIAEGPLNLRLAMTQKADWGQFLIVSATKTIAGEKIIGDGRRPGYPLDYRWLGHGTKYGSSDGCPVYKRGDDDTDQFAALMQSLANWGLYGGYSISGFLSDDNDFPYQPGYKKGSW